MNRTTEALREKLVSSIKSDGPMAVAYSGGVDSTTLVALAAEILPREQVLAIFVDAPQMKRTEKEEALSLLRERGIPYLEFSMDSFALEAFRENRRDRCYACKRRMMEAVTEAARGAGFSKVADGQNADDAKDYRPGAKAAAELGVRSPFKECGFTKEDIRALAKELGLPVWDKPADSCLATRFPYCTRLSAEKLRQVEAAEALLKARGFREARVRVHEELARIEVPRSGFSAILKEEGLADELRRCGFHYVTLDLEGYSRGRFDAEEEKQ